ncbi:hypothetical protein SODALDRAFT_393387 [Sodiomyces alkalinus F11]|uniref:WD40 repeat-like protein n=1 Tax=Sodiomyces alkalinus (strain CBS 110278 / VKM F-3762 / F11) TaxID=1314773 RepID=A0A3N2PMC9_SODAK|nr:hypothetical protein SODALDRAFT_393387 [Sodiomyces alkalinus F11]ROT35687.1 hypothetical protein SODALDRAFT_393387 [Sodiomyces alkalinus F11]
MVEELPRHNVSKGPVSNSASSSSVASPDIKPVAPSAYDANLTISPPLDALSATSVSASTGVSNHHEWTRSALAGSPGNLISLMGESPPTQPSSYEDHARLPPGWATRRPIMTPQAASPSPPSSVPSSLRRPLSYQQDPMHAAELHAQVAATAAYRRASVQSPFSHARAGPYPPPPHLPQAHFYGTPDLDFDVGPQTGIKAGENGYHFGLDTLPSAPSSSELSPGSDNVVVAGYEGGLEVYSVSKRGLQRVTGLKGLRGGVLHATILPWIGSDEHADVYPLVAVVVHGPVLPAGAPEDGPRVASPEERPELCNSPRTDASHRDAATGRSLATVEHYQTSVELYSLKSNKLIDVLLEAPKIPLATPITSPIFKAPLPTGTFVIQADGGNIAVASGSTGEVWVYRRIEGLYGDGGVRFGCAGKLWTSLQQAPRGGEVTEESGGRPSPAPSSARPNPPTPILALNGRWIAYCPPAPSSQIAIRAHVPVPMLGKGPGLSSVTPPVLPTVTSGAELPISEGMMNKIMRETTQEIISGAKWVGQQGLQAWNAYWNKNTSQQGGRQPRSPPLAPQQWSSSYPQRSDPVQFPPTHGTPGKAVASREPGLVTVLDLATLSQSASSHPVTTFQTPLGCSFLSFSPSGLFLFTASTKGDVQTVWDLMCIQYTKSSPLQAVAATSTVGPRVRQVAHFSRMTVARIVEVAWSRPNGERIAMVTERGTVHLLDMPGNAFTWPPPRRRRMTEPNGAPASESPGSAVSMASTAFGAAFEAARPLIDRSRRGSSNGPGLNSANLVDSASQGGRAIAATISHSLGKTGTAINQLRHTGENRVSLPPSVVPPSASCVTWLAGRRYHRLFVVGSGLVRTFPSKSRRGLVASEKQRGSRGNRYMDFKFPTLPDDTLAPMVRHFLDSDEYLDLSDREMDAGNTLTLEPRTTAVQAEISAEACIPQAEIESSAPYQPFHTDRRVSVFEYATSADVASEVPAVTALLAEATLDDPPSSKSKRKQARQASQAAPAAHDVSRRHWAFGQPIDLFKLHLDHGILQDEEWDASEETRALPSSSMERVMRVGGNRDEIVVTTRRRRGARHMVDEHGFFEDDCEVLDFADQRV